MSAKLKKRKSEYEKAKSNLSRMFVRRSEQQSVRCATFFLVQTFLKQKKKLTPFQVFAVMGKTLDRLSLVCKVKGKPGTYKGVMSNPSPLQEEIQCDRCPLNHRPSRFFCTGNKPGVEKSPLSRKNTLYSVQSGNPLGKFNIVESISGPGKKTYEVTIEVTGLKEEDIPFRNPEEIEIDDSILELLRE